MKVFIPEIIPSFNKGEEAIFRGIEKTLEAGGPFVKIFLVSNNPEYDKKNYGEHVEIIDEGLLPISSMDKKEKLIHFFKQGFLHILFLCIYWLIGCRAIKLFRKPLWRAYCEADVILLGHDNAYSKFHNFLIIFAKLMKKPVAIYGASILPRAYKGFLIRRITNYCVSKADLITTREKYSADFLIKMGINSSIVHVTADKAFLLDPAPPERGLEILRQEGIDVEHRPLIGFTVVRGSDVYSYGLRKFTDPNEKYSFHIKIIASVIDRIIMKYAAQVVFIPHSVGPGVYDDRQVAHDILSCTRNTEYVKVMCGDYSARDLKSVLGHLDFLIGERTHSIIGAASMTVPFISISYPEDLRTYGIIGDMLGQKKSLYNIEKMTAESLFSSFEEAWFKREQMRAELVLRLPYVKDLALKNGILLFDMLCRKGHRAMKI